MSTTLYLTDYSAAVDPNNGGTASVSNNANCIFVDMDETGPVGSGTNALTIAGNTSTVLYYVGRFSEWQLTTVQAGTWTVFWDITALTGSAPTLNSICISKINNSGTGVTTIAAINLGGISLATGSHSQTLTGSSCSFNASETVCISFQCSGNGAGGNVTFKNDQTLTAPAQVAYTPSVIVVPKRRKLTYPKVYIDRSELRRKRRRMPQNLFTPHFLAIDIATGIDLAAYTLTATDSGTGTDSASFSLLGQDTSTGTELLSLAQIQVDSAIGTDTASVAVSVTAIDSSGSGTDTCAFTLIAIDTGTAVDSVIAGPLAIDPAVGSESFSISAAIIGTDTATGDDSQSSFLASYSVVDTATGSDANWVGFTVADSATGVDSLVSIALSLADYAAGVDAFFIAAVLSASDSAQGSSVLSLSVSLSAVADSATGADNAFYSTAYVLIDSGTGIDSISGRTISVADPANGSEVLSFAAAFSAVDTAIGSALASLAETGMTASDAATGTDTATVSASLIAIDSATGTDSVSQLVAGYSDSAIGSDAGSVLNQLSGLDLASGLEALSLRVILPTANESATGVDSVNLIAAILAVDSGTGSSSTSLSAALLAIDNSYGNGIDSASVSINNILTDSAVGTDSAFVTGLNFPITGGQIYGGGQTP